MRIDFDGEITGVSDPSAFWGIAKFILEIA